MKAIKNNLLSINNRVKAALIVLFCLFSLSAFSQLTPRDGSSATNMPNLTLKGQYDIKMVAAPVLQCVWVKTNTPLEILRPLTDQEMLQDGKYLSLNNEVSCASGEGTNNVKPISKLHTSAQPYAPVGAIGISTVYADCDDDMSTFQSSAAYVDFGEDMSCTTVEAAYLYWAGNNDALTTTYAPYPGTLTMKSHAGGATGTATGYNTVLFKPKGDKTYTTVKADRVLTTKDQYVCFADVTKLVKGKKGGLYWVANVRNSGWDDGGGSKGGWNLVVVFRPPNCPPRVIKFWDGFVDPANGNSVTLNFAAGEVPKSGNSVSYMGFTTLDAETNAGIVAEKGIPSTTANTGVQFQSLPGGTVQYINPFVTDQPGVTVTTSAGLVVNNVQDGMGSGRISTYDPLTDKNGNELTRLPPVINTLGFGANHLKLPAGSMVPGATKATMTFPDDLNGSYSSYMAYMAIETLQPDLRLSLRSENSSSAPGGAIDYVLTIQNVGPLASKLGAYVLDTLPKMLDFDPASIQYVRGTAPQPYEISNVGQDVNENLKLYLPVIAKGNGTVATDSVVIKFSAKLKDLSRTDIWAYGCNRNANNRATIVFQADDGSDMIGGSNSSGGCDAQGSFYQTKISSTSLDSLYYATKFDTIPLTAEVNAATSQGKKIYIYDRVKKDLAASLIKLGLTASDTVKYDVFVDPENPSTIINRAQYFTQDEAYQTYVAHANLGAGCEENYTVTYIVAKVPQYEINTSTIKQPKFIGDASGEIELQVKDGSAPYTLSIYNEAGDLVYSSSSPTDYTFKINTLPAGKYNLTISDQGTIPGTGSFEITDPSAFTLSSLTQNKESVVATSTGGNGANTYMWYTSTNGGTTWTYLNPSSLPAGVTITTAADGKTSTLTDQNIGAALYEVYVCDGYSSDSKQITSVAKPKIALDDNNPVVSITTNPTIVLNANVTGGTQPMKYTWEVSPDGVNWYNVNALPGTLFGSYSTSGSSLTITNITNIAMSGYKVRVAAIDATGWAVVDASSNSSVSTLTVVKGPAVKVTSETDVTCPGDTNGSIEFTLSSGEPGQVYIAKLYEGDYPDATSLAAANPTPKAQITYPTSTVLKSVGNCAANSYTVVLEPQAPLQVGAETWYDCPSTGFPSFVVGSPAPLVPLISCSDASQCIGSNITLNASVAGGAGNGENVDFVWRYSNDGVNFTNFGSKVVYPTIEGTSTIYKIEKDVYFDVHATDGGSCPIDAPSVFVKALETPEVGFEASVDTGCYKYDLHNLKVLQLNENIRNGDYKLTLHSMLPLTYDDNTHIIAESDYILKNNSVVYARLYSGASCYDAKSVAIVLRSMESCYPIYIPDFFSPDGDGINDLFQMANLEEYDNPKITIYDRFGKVVFEGGKEKLLPPNGWDGKYLGHPVPSGDYWYQMIFSEMKPKVGHFSLKRKKE